MRAERTKERSSNAISASSFTTAIIMILVLMVATYFLTLLIPSGSYDRQLVDGAETVVADSFHYTSGGIPFWKWLLSPFLVLGSDSSTTLIAIILFLVVVGGIFSCLDSSGLMVYMLSKISSRFETRKYRLLGVITLFFMAMGSFIGSFEECVPLVPIAIALAAAMGWDALVGLGMSLLAVGCGFASGITNPFTVGVAQELAGLPMFSGVSLRILTFGVIYLLLLLFLIRYAKLVEADPSRSLLYGRGKAAAAERPTFVKSVKMDRALLLFVGILGLGIAFIFSSAFIPALQDFTMPIVALVFLIAGIASVFTAGMNGREFLRRFVSGALSILPAVLLILMASSVKYTLTESGTLDTILHYAAGVVQQLPSWSAILFIYLIALVMEFFISSGSAKAVLLIPLLAPLADLSSLTRQSMVLAYVFGDGFSNVFYFTNPVLLISLGLAGFGYGTWLKWTWKVQLAILGVTVGILLLACAVGY